MIAVTKSRLQVTEHAGGRMIESTAREVPGVELERYWREPSRPSSHR